LTTPDHYSLTRTVPAGWPEPALKEIVMSRIRHIRRIAAVLGGLAIRNLSTRTRRSAIGAAAVVPALLIGVLGAQHER
jgi:hypothetical protein